MAKKNDARTTHIGAKCSKCGYMRRNFEKSTSNTSDKLVLKKYCPKCKSVQEFKEAKLGK